MTSAVPVTLPSALSELRARARNSVVLCNAGEETLEQQISGIFYTFPPGVPVEITDRLSWQIGAKGVLLTNEPKVVLPGADAVSIAAEILIEEDHRLGSKGLTLLAKDGLDDERMRMARERSIRYRVSRAKGIQREWILKCEANAKDPSALPLRQPDRVRSEIAFLSRFEAGLIDRKKYICKIDGFESDSRDEVALYIRRQYGQQVATAGGVDSFIVDRDVVMATPTKADQPKGEVAQPVLEPVPAAPTGPVAVEDRLPPSDPAWLIEKADALGVTYLKRELVALLRGDTAVLAELAARVKDAARKKELNDDGE